MRFRRIVSVAVAAGLLALPHIGTAMADETPAGMDTVADMVEQAANAEFHGNGIVMCSWGSDSAAATYEVARSAGMSIVHGPDGDAMAQDGVSAIRSGSNWYGTEVDEWAAWAVSERYSLGATVATVHLGRPALVMTVIEDGRPRARMIIDAESTVPLLTEVLDADGTVFRTAALVSFTPEAQEMPDTMPEVEVMNRASRMSAPASLPESVAGYRRADVYDAGPGAVHAFYTDGLFSFSVFEVGRADRPPAFDKATEFEVGGKTYRRIVTPTSLWIHWNAPDRTYVLVGDLPPDHLREVLERLPAPGERGFLVRLWRRLFG